MVYFFSKFLHICSVDLRSVIATVKSFGVVFVLLHCHTHKTIHWASMPCGQGWDYLGIDHLCVYEINKHSSQNISLIFIHMVEWSISYVRPLPPPPWCRYCSPLCPKPALSSALLSTSQWRNISLCPLLVSTYKNHKREKNILFNSGAVTMLCTVPL